MNEFIEGNPRVWKRYALRPRPLSHDSQNLRLLHASLPLSQMTRSIEETLSLIAHERRNPLAVIAGLADILHRSRSTMHDGEQDATWLQISDEAGRLQRAVSSMLLLADRAPTVQAEVEPFSL